jgi:hypothetical protein
MSATARQAVVLTISLLAVVPAYGQEPREPSHRLVTIAADGTISLAASRTPLQALLTEISVQTRIPILLAEALEPERVSATVRNLAFDDLMKRLLDQYDAFYLFGPRDKKPSSIRAIWVYPKGEGDTLEPVPPTVWASTKDLKAQVDDPEVSVRMDAIETLIERLGTQALPMVLRGLADGDEIVRLGTVLAAIEAGVEIPATELHSVVLNDQSPQVRIAALRAVEGRPEAQSIASGVKNDPDEDIRNQALFILGELPITQPQRRPQ